MTRPVRTLTATAATLALAAALAACGEDAVPAAGTASDSASDPAPPDAGQDDGQDGAPSTPAEPPSGEPGGGPAGEPGTDGATVPLYLVGDTPQGPALYREFVAVGDGYPLLEAASALVAGEGRDPDYRTLLGGLGIDAVTSRAGLIDVALTEDSVTNDKAVSPADGRLAVQSLVYTLQGTAGSRTPVQVSQGGVPVTLYGVDTAGGVQAAPELDVLAHVSITAPAEGEVVSGSFTLEGRASSFEATVPWQIRDESGQVVEEYSLMADGWIDKLWPFSGEIDVSGLEPGTYTLAALTDDPSGGEGGGPHEDTRTIVVE